MATKLDFLKEPPMVTVVVNHQRVVSIGYHGAIELCRMLDAALRSIEEELPFRPAQSLELSINHGGQSVSIREANACILFLVGGRVAFDAPTAPVDGGPSVARRIWALLKQSALEIEEEQNAERVAFDAAILQRSGAPIGLTNHPRIQAEASKMAQDDRDIRRFMSDRRKGPVLGTPTISHSTPEQSLMRLLGRMNAKCRSAVVASL